MAATRAFINFAFNYWGTIPISYRDACHHIVIANTFLRWYTRRSCKRFGRPHIKGRHFVSRVIGDTKVWVKEGLLPTTHNWLGLILTPTQLWLFTMQSFYGTTLFFLKTVKGTLRGARKKLNNLHVLRESNKIGLVSSFW